MCGLRAAALTAQGGTAPGALAALAAPVLGLALFLSNGAFHRLALGAVTLVTLAALAALHLGRSEGGARPATWGRLTLGFLWAGVAASFAIDVTHPPGIYVAPAGLGWFRPALAALGLLVATHALAVPPRLARVRFGLELAVAAALGAMVLRASPRPHIDVWYMEQLGATALLRGVNPYAMGYPNIYGPDTRLIAGSLLSPDRAQVLAFPYPPLTLLLVAPAAALAADPRWAMLAATLFSAWAIRRLGRGSAEASLAAVLLLVQPRALFVLEQAWTEPLVLAATLAVALLLSRRPDARSPGADVGWTRPRTWLPVALAGALALSTKQYAALVLAPLLLTVPGAVRRRTATVAAAGALAVALPFLLWDPAAFLRGVIRFQLEQPFRSDALSWPAAVSRYAGVQPPAWPAFALAGAVLLFVARGPVSVARALTASAAAWLVLVVLNKQAFCNYYWLAVGLLCAAVAAGSRGDARDPSR